MATYDYIVCGGGTAGCVLGARLAQRTGLSVLVLEAGPSNKDVPPSAIPAAVSKITGTDADWKIVSEPCAKLNNRQLNLHRGKFLGGSSGCNGTLCIRGTKQDYDDWAVPGWSGSQMFEYMKKAEDFQNKHWFQPDLTAHGYQGPVLTAPHDAAPISYSVLDSFKSSGLPLNPDMFSTGSTANGCGHAVRTAYKGTRTTSVDYITSSDTNSSLKILTGQSVDKLGFRKEEGNPLRASTVYVRDAKSGYVVLYEARKEIVLTAGAYGSPAVLLRSGIGPRSELSQLAIHAKVDLPGVGKNLQDHMVILNFYEVNKPGLTHDNLLWHTGAAEKSMQQYKESKTGFFSQFPFGCFAFARLDERLQVDPAWRAAAANRNDSRDAVGTTKDQPHVEFWNTECYAPKYQFKDFPPDGKYAFALATTFFSQQSRGEVTLVSADPMANPKVQHNYLEDDRDMLVFTEACKLANEIVLHGDGTKDIVVGSWPASQGHDKYTTNAEWEKAIRERADTCYHPGGSCKMGTADDKMAVVDEKLRVYGVSGLRIADASIMPTLPSGHPQMAVFGIAEKAADLIAADAN